MIYINYSRLIKMLIIYLKTDILQFQETNKQSYKISTNQNIQSIIYNAVQHNISTIVLRKF